MVATATPKDQGWSFVVLAAAFWVNWIQCTTYLTGILYVAWLETFNASRSTTAWVIALQQALICLPCPLVSAIQTRSNARWLLMCGGFLTSLRYVLSALAQELYHLTLAFGLAGIGISMTITTNLVIVGDYFDKYRNLAFGVAMMGGGGSMIVTSLLQQYLMDLYGWRGTMWITGGIFLHLCLCGALMRPIVTEQDAVRPTLSKASAKSKRTVPFNLSLLINPHFMVYSVSQLLFFIAMFIALGHIPAFARFQGSTPAQTAGLMSVWGIGNLIIRPLIGLALHFPRVNIFLLYIAMCVFCGGGNILLVLIGATLPGQITAVFLIALFSNTQATMMPPICIQISGIKKLGDSIAILHVFIGLGCLAGPPLGGWLFDVTGSYTYSFYFAASCMVLAGGIMIPVVVARWRKMSGSTSGQAQGSSEQVNRTITVHVSIDEIPLNDLRTKKIKYNVASHEST